MSNDNKKTALPKLRFSEFRQAGEWEANTLGSIAAVAKGVQVNKIDLSADMKYPVMNGGISPSGYLNTFNRQAETICISEGGNSCGFVNLMTTPFWSGGHNYTLDKLNNTSTDFLFQFLKFKEKEIMALRVGSGLPNIQIGALRSFDVFYPSPEEQQKVADTLSSLDDLLTAQSAKLEALKAHKRGLMQALFPAEGETVPKLRFPEFQGVGEWKKEKLGNLVEQKGRIGYRGYTVADIVEEGQGAISLSPGNITSEGYLTFAKSTFISWQKYDESPEIMLSEGFTVLVKTGYSFGKAALIKDLPEKATINPQLVVLKPTHINSVFLHLLVSNTDVQKQINDRISGGDIPSMSQGTISKFDVLIPSEAEQQKIADCLSSLDNRITAQSQKIEALKLHKKGLMQHLFPAAAEPTA